MALLIGGGSPDGNVDPWNSAGKGSVHLRIDATDDQSPLYVKVDADGADDDWVPTVVHMDEAARTLEANLTLDADKRVYFRDTNCSIYSDSGSKLYISTASGVDIEKMKVGSGHTFNHLLAGSATISCACAASGATIATCVSITGLTQTHKIFLAPSTISTCLVLNKWACSPGGGVLTASVVNLGAASTASANIIVSYLAIAACGI